MSLKVGGVWLGIHSVGLYDIYPTPGLVLGRFGVLVERSFRFVQAPVSKLHDSQEVSATMGGLQKTRLYGYAEPQILFGADLLG